MAGKQKVTKTIHAVGRRKSAVARVYMVEGKGNISVNGQDIQSYFGSTTMYPSAATRPFSVVEAKDQFDVKVVVKGGGLTGQADAISLALARALCLQELKSNPLATPVQEGEDGDDEATIVSRPWKALLKSNKLLTRDSRAVERKKYGYRKARKKEQYSKR